MRQITGLEISPDGDVLRFSDGSEVVRPAGWAVSKGHPDSPVCGMLLDEDGETLSEAEHKPPPVVDTSRPIIDPSKVTGLGDLRGAL